MSDKWFKLFLNPEPWAVGSVSIGKQDGKHVGRISPNPNLAAFQNAVKEEMQDVPKLSSEYRRFEFYFWRQQARYIDVADRVRQRNQADATNLQKGLEDALQGILFDNDREVVDIRSVMMSQGTHTNPLILIRAMRVWNSPYADIPADLLEGALNDAHRPDSAIKQSKWEKSEDLF